MSSCLRAAANLGHQALALVNGDEEELTVQTIAPLARDRHAIYAAGLPDSFPAVGDGDRSAISITNFWTISHAVPSYTRCHARLS